MADLHVFRDDYEFRVAASGADATAQQMKESGLPAEDCTPPEDWNEYPDERDLTFIHEDGTKVVKRAGEWAAELGPGCFGGTES